MFLDDEIDFEQSCTVNWRELTPDQLASMIDRWENERAELAKDVTETQNSDKT